MSSPTSQPSRFTRFIGVDVAKANLVIADQGKLRELPNRKRNLSHWLQSLPAGCAIALEAIALEATNTYHQLLANLALAAGHTVYLLNLSAQPQATQALPHRYGDKG